MAMNGNQEFLQSGRLQKKGESLGLWKAFDFILEKSSNGRGAVLIYSGAGVLGLESRCVRLRKNNVIFEIPPEGGKGDFSITIKNWHSKTCGACNFGKVGSALPKYRTFHFRAQSVEEKDRWLSAIKEVVSKKVSSPRDSPIGGPEISTYDDHGDATSSLSSDGEMPSLMYDDVLPNELAISPEAPKEIKSKKFTRSISLRMDDFAASDLKISDLTGCPGETSASETDEHSRKVLELCVASMEGNLGICKRLIEQDHVDVNSADANGFAPLHSACVAGHANLVGYLIRAGANVTARNLFSSTPAILAAAHGHVDVLKRLAKHPEVDLEACTDSGATPLHISCQQGKLCAVKFLIEKGVDLNRLTSKGATALMLASKKGHTAIVQILLDNNADVAVHKNSESGAGSAMMFARTEGHQDIVQLILDHDLGLGEEETPSFAKKIGAKLNNKRVKKKSGKLGRN